MSEFNFDNMKNVDIPDSWIEGALKVPKDTIHPTPFLKYSKIIAFAASIVLVCSISVALFFVTNDNPVVPPIKYDETECNTFGENTDSTIESSVDVTTKETNAEKNTTEAVESEEQTVFESSAKNKKPTSFKPEKTEPTEFCMPTTNGSIENDKDDGRIPSNPNSAPDSNPNPDSVPDSNPNKPRPTQSGGKPTAPPATENGAQEKPTVRPDGPEPPEKVESYVKSYESGIITAKIHKEDLSEMMYCRIYDENGNIIGDSNLFSNSKRAQIAAKAEGSDDFVQADDYNTVEYNTERLGTNLGAGNYRVVFYGKNGVDICNGYIYVS